MKKIPLTGIFYTAMFLLAGLLVLASGRGSSQAAMARPFQIHFEGEYSKTVGNGSLWTQIQTFLPIVGTSFSAAVSTRSCGRG